MCGIFSAFSDEFGSCVSNMKRHHDPSNLGALMFEAFTKADLDAVAGFVKDNPNLVSLSGRQFLEENYKVIKSVFMCIYSIYCTLVIGSYAAH